MNRLDYSIQMTYRAGDEEDNVKEPEPFYLCGCCEMYHPLDWWGDCRDNDNRYTPDDLDKEYGDGWVEVPQP